MGYWFRDVCCIVGRALFYLDFGAGVSRVVEFCGFIFLWGHGVMNVNLMSVLFVFFAFMLVLQCGGCFFLDSVFGSVVA